MAKTYQNPTNVDEAVKQMIPIVKNIARKYTRNHYGDYNDYVQEGYVGVMEAWERYDTSKNNRFSTYAYFWVRAKIQQLAIPDWKYKNNTASQDLLDFNGTYETNLDAISIQQSIDKMTDNDKKIFELKQQGYTFQEMADMLGEDSLHRVRNKYIKLEKTIQEAMV